MERHSMPKTKNTIPAKRPKELSAEEAKKIYDQTNAASTSTSQTPEEPSSAASNHLDTQEKVIAPVNTSAVTTPTQSTTVDTANHTKPPIAESAAATAKTPFYAHFGLSSIATGIGVTTAIYFMNKSKSVESNHPASVNGEKTLRIVEDSSDTSNTVWTVEDADKQQNKLITGIFQGQYGTLTVSADGNLQYKLSTPSQTIQAMPANEQWVDTFNVKTVDGTSTLLTVNIVGQNDAAVIGGDTSAKIFENGTTPVSGQLTINDLDKGQNSFTASNFTTPYGTLSLDAQGRWTYQLQSNNLMLNSLSAGTTITDTVLIQSIDGTEKAIQLHIAGENDPALIGGQTTFTTHEDLLNNSVAGQLTLTDIDLGETAFTPAVITGAYGTLTFSASGAYQYQLLNNGEALQSLSASQSVVDTFTIHSQDGTQQTVQATIQGINDQPKTIDDTYNVYFYGEQFNVKNRAQWVDAIPNISQQALVNNLGGVAGFGERVLSNNYYYSNSELIDISSVFPSGINIEGTLYKSLYVDDQGAVYTPDFNHSFFISTEENYQTNQDAQTPTVGGNSTGSNRTYIDLDTTTNTLTFTWDDLRPSQYYSNNPADAFQLQIIRDNSNDYKLVYRVEDINTPVSSLYVGWTTLKSNYPNHYVQATHLTTNKKEGEPYENSIGNTAYQGVWTARSTQGVLSDEPILSYIFSPFENDTDPEQDALTLTRATLLEGEGLVEIDNNQIRYFPAADMPSGLISNVRIEYTVQDTFGAQSTGVSTLIIENAPNTSPYGFGSSFYGYEDRAISFSLSDFSYYDAEGDALNHVIIDSLPNKGTLALNGSPVSLGQSIPADQLETLTFLGLPNEYGDSYSSFNFRLQDDGGTSLNGQDTSAPQTMRINLYNTSDAPTSANVSLDVQRSNAYRFKTTDFPFSDIDGDRLSSIVIESLPNAGILQLRNDYYSSTSAITAGQSVYSSSLDPYYSTYFSYTPPADTSITETSFTYRVGDYGNAYDGGNLSDIYTATLHII